MLAQYAAAGEDLDKQGALQLFLILKLESAGTVPSYDNGTSLRLYIVFQESEGHLACCKGGPGMSFFN